MSLCQLVIWSMAAILRDSTVVVVAAAVVRTRRRAIPLAMLTTRKSTHGFSFVSHIWVAYGAPQRTLMKLQKVFKFGMINRAMYCIFGWVEKIGKV